MHTAIYFVAFTKFDSSYIVSAFGHHKSVVLIIISRTVCHNMVVITNNSNHNSQCMHSETVCPNVVDIANNSKGREY